VALLSIHYCNNWLVPAQHGTSLIFLLGHVPIAVTCGKTNALQRTRSSAAEPVITAPEKAFHKLLAFRSVGTDCIR